MSDRRVVVTGLGAVTPAGIGVDRLWETLSNGRSCETLMPELDHFGMESRIFGSLRDFDPIGAGLDAEFVNRNDRCAQFAMLAAEEAIAQSGLVASHPDGDRCGVNIGTAVAGSTGMETMWVELTDGGAHPLPGHAPEHLYQYFCPTVPALEVAARYGFRGPVLATSTGCTAGLDAIGNALRTIRRGEADVMLAGASEAPLTPIAIAAFDVIQAITRKPVEAVGTASAPFSADRDGFVLAEGCGLLLLEELGHAQRRGATILGEVISFGSVSNAYHMTGLPAEGHDLARAIDIAIQEAGFVPRDIDYINAHGSSTLQNDRNETSAFHLALGEAARKIPVASLKSMLGHPLGAASSIAVIASIEAIRHGFLLPTINHRNRADDCDLDYVPNQGRAADLEAVLTNCSGFSGLHSALVLSRYVDYDSARAG